MCHGAAKIKGVSLKRMRSMALFLRAYTKTNSYECRDKSTQNKPG